MFNILRITGLFRIFLTQIFAVFFLSGFSVYLFHASQNSAGHALAKSSLSLIIGMLCFSWAIWQMIRPHEEIESLFFNLRPGPIVSANPLLGIVEYPFASTHPSYLLIDVLSLSIISAGYLITKFQYCSMDALHTRFLAAFLIGLSFPLVRLFCWYALHKQVGLKAQKGLWRSATLIASILVIPMTIALGIFGTKAVASANPPLMDGAHSSALMQTVLDKKVHLHGTLKSHYPVQCECGEQEECKAAAILVQLKNGEEVIIVARNEATKVVLNDATQDPGSPVHYSGKLHATQDESICGVMDLGHKEKSVSIILEVE